MSSFRSVFSASLALFAVLTPVLHGFDKRLPSLSWFYSLGEPLQQFLLFLEGKVFLPLSAALQGKQSAFIPEDALFAASSWQVGLNWLLGLLVSGIMLWLAWRISFSKRGLNLDPILQRRLERFQKIRRGWIAWWITLGLIGFACLDFLVVGKRALVVVYEGNWYFPAFQEQDIPAKQFAVGGDEEANYRELAKFMKQENVSGFVLLPLIPWDPTYDSDEEMKRPVRRNEDGIFVLEGSKSAFSGVVISYHDEELILRSRQVRMREGKLHGPEERFDREGNLIGFVTWEYGNCVECAKGLTPEAEENFQETKFSPLPPHWGRRHYLGTNSSGWDVAAQLFGGLQVILQGLVCYLLVTYVLGILVGTAMGFFGGTFDLIMQRLMEILAAVPLLLVIIILTSNLGKDKIGVTTLVGLVCLFRWIGVATYMRSATYKEKQRDYVAAAKSLGAGVPRILARHVLPNVLAIIVTLIPFEVVFFSGFLTSLDFIGFGLGDQYASWGRLMQDGLSYLNAPWIVSSVFFVLVVVLLLFTFIGEALREAFDPKKFTTYK